MMRHTLSLQAGLVATLMLTARLAAADDVAWKPEWRRFDWKEGIATGGLIVTSYLEDQYLTGPSSPHWTGAILLDNAVRGVLRGDNHVQRAVTKYADVEYTMLTLFPYFDAGVALAIHRSPDVATQMALIDVQSLSFTSSVTLFTKWLTGRQRPYARDCSPGATVGTHVCGTSYDNIGFFSGHTSATFTGAALTCVHHEHLPLYGGGLADAWACAWALLNASATAVMRIVSDDHYASDVLVAAGVGFVSGYVLPSWLHYGFGRASPRPSSLGLASGVMPTLQPVVGGIGVGVVFAM